MKKIGIFMADGCEEIEGLTVVDLVRRAKLEIVMISISDTKEVTGSHGVKFMADALAGNGAPWRKRDGKPRYPRVCIGRKAGCGNLCSTERAWGSRTVAGTVRNLSSGI